MNVRTYHHVHSKYQILRLLVVSAPIRKHPSSANNCYDLSCNTTHDYLRHHLAYQIANYLLVVRLDFQQHIVCILETYSDLNRCSLQFRRHSLCV